MRTFFYNDVIYSTSNNDYNNYENKHLTPHHRRCIDGKTTGCSKCVGYCKFREHPGFLTRELRKRHDCLKKGCYYYVPKTKSVKSSNVFLEAMCLLKA